MASTDMQQVVCDDKSNEHSEQIQEAANNNSHFNEVVNRFSKFEPYCDGFHLALFFLEACDTRFRFEDIILDRVKSVPLNAAKINKPPYRSVNVENSPYPIRPHVGPALNLDSSKLPPECLEYIRNNPECDPARVTSGLFRAKRRVILLQQVAKILGYD